MEKDITKKIKPFIIYSVPIILLIAVVAIFGVYKWNQGQGIININDAKLTSSKVMVVAQNDGTLTEKDEIDGKKLERVRGISFIDNDAVNLISGLFSASLGLLLSQIF